MLVSDSLERAEMLRSVRADASNINVKRLTWFDVGRFVSMRHELEAESTHLGPNGGERKAKESDWYTLLRMLVNRKRMFTFVAEDGGQMVGFISLIFAKFKKFSGNAYITISVRASHRGKNIGTKLMETAESFARSKGIRRLELEVFSRNDGAIKLYERLGYEIEGRRRNAVFDNGEFDDVVLMAKFIA